MIYSATLNDDGSIVIDGEGLAPKQRKRPGRRRFSDVVLKRLDINNPDSGPQKLIVVEQIEIGSGTRLVAEFPVPGVLPPPGTYRLTVKNKRGEAHIGFTIPALMIREGSVTVPIEDPPTLRVSCLEGEHVAMFQITAKKVAKFKAGAALANNLRAQGVTCASLLAPPRVECRVDHSTSGGDIEVKRRTDHSTAGGDIEVKPNRLNLSVLCAR
ncbi:MAG: hypothetical protein ACE5G9_13915 [Nitrospinales bacterium]